VKQLGVAAYILAKFDVERGAGSEVRGGSLSTALAFRHLIFLKSIHSLQECSLTSCNFCSSSGKIKLGFSLTLLVSCSASIIEKIGHTSSCLTLEGGTDRLDRNVGNYLPINAV
jgi:hypothetical protein